MVGNEQRRGPKKKKMQKKRDFLGVGIGIDICLNFFTILLGFAPFGFPNFCVSPSLSFLLCVFLFFCWVSWYELKLKEARTTATALLPLFRFASCSVRCKMH